MPRLRRPKRHTAQADLSSSEALIAHSGWRSRSCGAKSMASAGTQGPAAGADGSSSWKPRGSREPGRQLAAKNAAAWTQRCSRSPASGRRRKPFPAHLPRERVVIPPRRAPVACCGSTKLCRSWARTITETLEVIPRQWKVIYDGAGKVFVPGMREDHAAAGTVPRDAAGFAWTEPAGHDPV